MIITRAPLRITLAGGGTDLPSYSDEFDGEVLSAAINKYVYVSVIQPFDDSIILKYSNNEKINNINNIKHQYFKIALKKFKIKKKIEITTLADIPSGTGLGSSGSFTVALLKSLNVFKNKKISTKELAENASQLEMHDLKMSVGRQDQYISAYGGLKNLIFKKNINIVKKIKISTNFEQLIENNSVLFFTGYTRSASKILKSQNNLLLENDKEILEKMSLIKKNCIEVKKAIRDSNFDDFCQLINEQWKNKVSRNKNISNSEINSIIDYGLKKGATAGKLLGAGGGGFILFLTDKKKNLVEAMTKYKLNPTYFKFDKEGIKTLNC